MRKLEKIFIVVKDECDKQKHISAIDCFDLIAQKAEVSPKRLPFYLHQLQQMGLIKYSIQDQFLYVTPAGQKVITKTNAAK